MIVYGKLIRRIRSVLHCTTLFFLAVFTNYAHSGQVFELYGINFQEHYLPFSEIKEGAFVGHVSLDEKTVSTFYSKILYNDDVYGDIKIYLTQGGTPVADRSVCHFASNPYFSYLPYENGVRLTSCPGERTYVVASKVRFHYTGRYSVTVSGTQYEYQISGVNPNTPLFDVFVADTDAVRRFAGKNTTLQLQGTLGYIYADKVQMTLKPPRTTAMVIHIGESQPTAFFPEKNSSHALLPLPVKPSGDLATGSASVDLCLYDGKGLTTSRYMLTFQDQNTANTSPYFAVYNSSGTGKMDYTVSLTDPSGTPQHVTNRNPFFWSSMQNGGAAQGRLRYIQLPGSDSRVPCVPSVVTVKVKPVPYKSLLAGKYSGNLGIIFTPSTN